MKLYFLCIYKIINYFMSLIKKKKKHDEILMLAKSKLSSISTLISQALIDTCTYIKEKYY